MDPWRSVVLPALLPFCAALLCVLPSALLWRRRGQDGELLPLPVPLSGALGVVGGYVAASWLLVGPPQWPAVSADERLLWMAAAAGVLVGLWGLVGRPAGLPRPIGALGLAALALWTARWILERSFEHIYPGAQGWLALGALAAALLGLTVGLAALVRRRPGWLSPALLSASAATAAGVLVLGRTAKLGQLSGALASALAGLALAGLLHRRLVIAGGATAAAAFVLVGLLAAGVVYNEVPPGVALLVLAAPLSQVLAELPGLRSLPPRNHRIARTALVVAVLAAALGWAWLARPPAYEY